MLFENIEYLLPEILIALTAMATLIIGVFNKREAILKSYNIAFISLVVAIGMLVLHTQNTVMLMHGEIIYDNFAWLLKILILATASLVLLSIRESVFTDSIAQPELPVLILLSVLGMMIMVSAQSFLSLFMGLELQSLALYVLSAMRRDDVRASEAGMKYFILGSLSTAIMLYGASLVYGSVGSVSFVAIADYLSINQTAPMIIYVGLVFVFSGLVFKISAVPFHMWTPDVYEGTPTSVTTFLASVPKIAAFGMIVRILSQPFVSIAPQWQAMIAVTAVLTMILGAFAALSQKNIKRLLAYSTIANMGYALMAMVVATPDSVQAAMLYIIIYTVTVIGFFTCLLTIQRRGVIIENIVDLAGLTKVFPGTTFVMVFTLFSMAGIPPLAGFIGKLYVFQIAIDAKMYWLAVIGVLTSVVSAAYYLWLVKTMMMDELSSVLKPLQTLKVRPINTVVVMWVVVGGLGLFFIKPSYFLQTLLAAATSLFVQ